MPGDSPGQTAEDSAEALATEEGLLPKQHTEALDADEHSIKPEEDGEEEERSEFLEPDEKADRAVSHLERLEARLQEVVASGPRRGSQAWDGAERGSRDTPTFISQMEQRLATPPIRRPSPLHISRSSPSVSLRDNLAKELASQQTRVSQLAQERLRMVGKQKDEELSRLHETHLKETSRLRQDLGAKEKENYQLTVKLRALETDLVLVKEENLSNCTLVDSQQKMINKLQEEIELLSADLEGKEAELAEREAVIQQAESDLQKRDALLDKAVGQLKKKHQEVESLSRKIRNRDVLQTKVDTIDSKYQQQHQQLKEFESRMVGLSKIIGGPVEDMSTSNVFDAVYSKLMAMKARINSLESIVERQRSQCTDASEEIASLRERNASLTTSLHAMQESLASKDREVSKVSTLMEKISEYRATIASLQQEVQYLQSSERDAGHHEAEVARLTTANATLVAENQRLQQQRTECLDRFQALQPLYMEKDRKCKEFDRLSAQHHSLLHFVDLVSETNHNADILRRYFVKLRSFHSTWQQRMGYLNMAHAFHKGWGHQLLSRVWYHWLVHHHRTARQKAASVEVQEELDQRHRESLDALRHEHTQQLNELKSRLQLSTKLVKELASNETKRKRSVRLLAEKIRALESANQTDQLQAKLEASKAQCAALEGQLAEAVAAKEAARVESEREVEELRSLVAAGREAERGLQLGLQQCMASEADHRVELVSEALVGLIQICCENGAVLSSAAEELGRVRDRLGAVEGRLHGAEEELAELRSGRSSLDEELEETRSQLEAVGKLKHDLEEQLRTLSAQWDSEREVFEERLRQAAAEREAEAAKLPELEGRFAELEGALREAEAKSEELRNSMESKEAEWSEERGELEKRLEAAEQEREEVKAEMQMRAMQSETDMRELEADLRVRMQQSEAAWTQTEKDLLAELEKAKEEVKRAEEARDAVERELRAELQRTEEDLRGAVSARDEELETKTAEIATLTERCARTAVLEEEGAGLRREVDQREREAAELSAKLSTAQQTAAEATAQCASLREALDEAVRARDSAESARKRAEDSLSRAESEHHSSVARCASLEEKCKTALTTATGLVSTLSEALRETGVPSVPVLGTPSKDCRGLEEEIARLKEELLEANARREEAERMVEHDTAERRRALNGGAVAKDPDHEEVMKMLSDASSSVSMLSEQAAHLSPPKALQLSPPSTARSAQDDMAMAEKVAELTESQATLYHALSAVCGKYSHTLDSLINCSDSVPVVNTR